MKVFNSTLAAIGLAAFVFASCSDSTDPPNSGNGNSVVDVTTIGLTSSTPTGVFNYKNSTANARKFFGSRAAGDVTFITAMPTDIPQEPNLKQELSTGNSKDLVFTEGGVNAYAIKNKNTVDLTGKRIKGVKIFVHGDATLIYDKSEGGNEIVLAKGAKVQYKGTGSMITATDKVYVTEASALLKSDNDIVIEGELYANWRGIGYESGKEQELRTGLGNTTTNAKGEKVVPTQNITFKNGSKAFIDGSLRAVNLNIEEGASVNATANILNATNVTVNGGLKFGGFLQAGNVTVNGTIDASSANTAIKVTGKLNMESGSSLTAHYVNVTNNEKDENNSVTKVGEAELNLKSGSNITISDGNVINVNNLNTDNASSGQITLAGNNAVAVIKADKFTNNGSDKIDAFATPGNNSVLLLQFTKCFNGNGEMPSAGDLDISASYLDYDKATNGDVVKLIDENHKKYGYELTVDINAIKSNKKLDLVAAFNPSNNAMSASCIQNVGDYIYVSYHTNGKASKGGLEVLHFEGNQIKPDQEVQGTTGLDINHLLVDNNRVYVAGGEVNKGAIFAYVPLQNNILTTGDDAMTTYVLNATEHNKLDANSITKYGDHFVVASTRGFEDFDSDFNHIWFEDTEVKSVVTANNKVYSLIATGANTTGTIKEFNTTMFNNASKTYTTNGNVGPENGKNTIAVDGTDLYVCQGARGLVRYNSNGDKVWDYVVPAIQNEKSDKYGAVKGYCNGVAISGNYVFVAAGGYGVVVLDKATGKELCHRIAFNGKQENGKWKNGNSANYVTVGKDGYIFVAYGQSRVQVFKLTSTTK